MRNNRTTKILGFSVPPTVVNEVESLAKEERRTKSELFREMVRVYRKYRLQRDRDELRWIDSIISEARAEQGGDPMTTAASLAESERLSRYGRQQARRTGQQTDSRSIDRTIHARRKTSRS